ncbi:hypothetical protein OROHE_014157 [Orobanche hederae]
MSFQEPTSLSFMPPIYLSSLNLSPSVLTLIAVSALLDRNTVVRILLLDLAMANSRFEEYPNSSDQPFKLKASYLFSPDDEALAQMKAISKSMVTENLEKFRLDCLPQPSNGGGRNCIATSDAAFG